MQKFLTLLKEEYKKHYIDHGLNERDAIAHAAAAVSGKSILNAIKLYNEGILNDVVEQLNSVSDRVSEAGDDSGDKYYINEYDVKETILKLKDSLI